MRPEALAALHAAAFAPARGWSAAEFDSFLADPACLLVARPEGFALARVTLDEAELLTIATDPARRRQGVARGLLGALFGGLAGRGAETPFLRDPTLSEEFIDELCEGRPAQGLFPAPQRRRRRCADLAPRAGLTPGFRSGTAQESVDPLPATRP